MPPAMIKLCAAKFPLLIFPIIFMMLVVLPLVIIVLVSFLKAYGLPFAFENFSLVNYQKILVDSIAVTDSIKNSLFLGFVSGIVCLFLGVMLSYVIYKVKPKGSGALETLAVLPYSLPRTVMPSAVFWHGAAPYLELRCTTPSGLSW